MNRTPYGMMAVTTLLWAGCTVAFEGRAEDSPVVSIQVLREDGGRVAWSAANNRIAFDRPGADGFYDIYTMNPDGSDERCVTCDKEGLIPQKHNGNPSWHPSGEYIVFQAEREKHPGLSSEATPGFGNYSDLWLARPDGSRFYQLTGTSSTPLGVLHPHFSPDGKQLSWSEKIDEANLLVPNEALGLWTINLADVALGPDGVRLQNVRSYRPGGDAFYENHGFLRDNRRMLFTSNFRPSEGALEFVSNDVYAWEPGTGAPQLLATDKYNEHAQPSPNGRKVVWMTSAENPLGGTDFWLMNADGTEKLRLTRFNDPENPLHRGRPLTAADSAWSPDGAYILGYVQTSLFKQTGMIVLIELDPAIAAAARD